MIAAKRFITISEFQSIRAGMKFDGVEVTRNDITDLREYIDSQNVYASSDGNTKLCSIPNGVMSTNFVGIIQTKSGLSIEILPKIYGKKGSKEDQVKVRQLFVKMLKASRNVTGFKTHSASLNTHKANLLEIFIAMFLKENSTLIRRGIMSGYVQVEDNRKYKKGKLLMKEHLRMNSLNQTNFYTQADEFIQDVIPNQIIKATLLFLLNQSHDIGNLRLIRQQLEYFSQISDIYEFDEIFNSVHLKRNFQYYQMVLDWCQVFLKRQSFTTFSGKSISIAILFPMDLIYQSYIAESLVQTLGPDKVTLQEQRYKLFDYKLSYQDDQLESTKSTRLSFLKPDIVIRQDDKTTIFDTKWKILDKHGPSIADLYQMYAYFTRYQHLGENIDRVVLVYPLSKLFENADFYSLLKQKLDEISEHIAAKIEVSYVDLDKDDVQQELANILAS